MNWPKLKEKLDVAAGTDTGVSPGVRFTPAAVLTHVTPHVTSKVSDGLMLDVPTIRTTTSTVVEKGLATIAVQP
jgi:hypothetical protein